MKSQDTPQMQPPVVILGASTASISSVSTDSRPINSRNISWWDGYKVSAEAVGTINLTSESNPLAVAKEKRKRRSSREMNKLQCKINRQKCESRTRYTKALKEASSRWYASCQQRDLGLTQESLETIQFIVYHVNSDLLEGGGRRITKTTAQSYIEN